MNKTRPLCAAPHCAIRNRHRDTCQHVDCPPACPDGRCGGCLPRWAADGLALCDVDTRRLAEDAIKLADQYLGLEAGIIRTGGGDREKTTGTSSGAPVPDDEVLELRARIGALLNAVTRLIADERGITRPVIGATAPDLAEHRRDPAALVAHRADDPRPAAEFIARHAEWLAAHRYGPTIARDLRAIAGDGRTWALAYPAGSDRMYVGDCPAIVADDDGTETTCGARLYQHAGQPLIACTGCGVEDTIEQWRRWIVGEAGGQGDAYMIAAHLAQTWMRPVDAAAVKKWAQRGHIAAVTVDDPDAPDGKRLLRDAKNRTVYEIESALSYAETLWGPSARLRRVS